MHVFRWISPISANESPAQLRFRFLFFVLDYVPETRIVFVGQENGTISQFHLSEDCNRLNPIKEYLAHNGRITELIFAKNSGWILSCARDKTFAAHCIETGNKIGGYSKTLACFFVSETFTCIFFFQPSKPGAPQWNSTRCPDTALWETTRDR